MPDGFASTVTDPPKAWTIRAVTANPNPTPSIPRRRASAERKNGSNTRSRSASGMPGPQSSTVTHTASPRRIAATVTGVLGRLYLRALSMTLSSACPNSGG